jgi:hypothetical protein
MRSRDMSQSNKTPMSCIRRRPVFGVSSSSRLPDAEAEKLVSDRLRYMIRLSEQDIKVLHDWSLVSGHQITFPGDAVRVVVGPFCDKEGVFWYARCRVPGGPLIRLSESILRGTGQPRERGPKARARIKSLRLLKQTLAAQARKLEENPLLLFTASAGKPEEDPLLLLLSMDFDDTYVDRVFLK